MAEISRKYTVTLCGKKTDPFQDTYTDKLSSDGKVVRTYRSDGSLCWKKTFTDKGEYIMTKYDDSGKNESYRVLGGFPDPETARLFFPCIRKNKKSTMPFCHQLLHSKQRY